MQFSESMRTVIDATMACAIACEECFTACLLEDDVKRMVGCIRLDRDCADVCRLTATLLTRQSVHGQHLLRECAEICEACAAECSKHEADHCQRCAEACRRCAEECRSLILGVAAPG